MRVFATSTIWAPICKGFSFYAHSYLATTDSHVTVRAGPVLPTCCALCGLRPNLKYKRLVLNTYNFIWYYWLNNTIFKIDKSCVGNYNNAIVPFIHIPKQLFEIVAIIFIDINCHSSLAFVKGPHKYEVTSMTYTFEFYLKHKYIENWFSTFLIFNPMKYIFLTCDRWMILLLFNNPINRYFCKKECLFLLDSNWKGFTLQNCALAGIVPPCGYWFGIQLTHQLWILNKLLWSSWDCFFFWFPVSSQSCEWKKWLSKYVNETYFLYIFY